MGTMTYEQASPMPRPEKVIKRRRPGRLVSYVVICVLIAVAVKSLVTNQNFGWDVVGQYFFSARILDGLAKTLELTAASMLLGIVLGVLLAIMRLSSNPLMTSVSWVYVWFFRGTPLFVQLLFWGYASALYPRLSIGIPFGPSLASANVNHLVTPLMAAILGLGLNEGAYMSEIVRAGIVSVNPGQTEAAQALGMSRAHTLRRIVLPQAMRVIVPPTANNVISMLKNTSLVSVLAFPELLYAAQLIYSDNFKTIPLLITASLWYLIVTSVLTAGQYYLEQHFNRGSGARRAGLVGRVWDLQKRGVVA